MTAVVLILLAILAIFGLPLFLILGSGAMAGYESSGNQLELYFASFYQQISDTPIYLAIPLFTLTGYLLAASKAPERLVRLSRAALGWLPGGLAIVALVTCAVFTAFTGASGVTIVALGGLLLPALLKDGYPRKFTMGLLTSSGSRGILFPPSLPLIVYAMVAGMALQNIDAETLCEMREKPAVVETVAATADKDSASAPAADTAKLSVDEQIAAAIAAEDEQAVRADENPPSQEQGQEKAAGDTAKLSVEEQIAAAIAAEDGNDEHDDAAPQEGVADSAVAAVAPRGGDAGGGTGGGMGREKCAASLGEEELFMRPTVNRLFVAGAVPGGLALLLFALYVGWFGRRHKVPRSKFNFMELLRALKGMAWEIPVPFIVVGGVLGGALTAVEAAAVATAWVLVVEVFIYKDIKFSGLGVVFRESMVLVGGILLILMSAQALTNFFIDVEIPQKLFTLVKDTINSPLTFLLILNVFLLVVGMLMDIFSAIQVVVPIITPVAIYYGVNPVHLGIVILTNLEIGFNTPPVGVNLFVGSLAFRRPVMELVRAVVPYLLISIVALILVTYWPALSVWMINVLDIK